ncbi:MAG: hypothetical protein ACOXZ9_03310 [Bacteroidales bacterium]|jgi:hypothetical protein
MKKYYLYFKETLFTKILILSMAFLLTSCYSDYLTIDYQLHHGAVWNDNQTKVAFVASKIAYRSAKGIAAFPDGGKPLYLVADVGLYVFDCEKKLLEELISFNDLTSSLGPWRAKWSVTLALTDTMVYYLLSPVSVSWNASLEEKYGQPRAFHIYTETDTTVDYTTFNNLLLEMEKCDLTSLGRLVSEVPLADWGLKLQEIYPKSDRAYINETIYLYSTRLNRRAVIEQIIAKKSKAEIKSILKEMDDYKNSLEEPWNTIYEQKSKDTYDQIKALL